jgi:hypothetical protein
MGKFKGIVTIENVKHKEEYQKLKNQLLDNLKIKLNLLSMQMS